MNNEIGRKLTSLTLMTIMLAGGMVIAAPSMVPEAAAAGQLYVSAENATFGNTFGGGQIVEIIVRDPNQSDTDAFESMPTVELNGDTVIMTQGADGYWYAYVADTDGVSDLDNAGTHAYGVDYGTDGATTGTVYSGSGAENLYKSVTIIGGAPEMSAMSATNHGQIGILVANIAEWPVLQTYDLSVGDTEIVLEQAGSDEVVVLDYSSLEDFSGIEIDRTTAPQGAEVHLTITDGQLNIDPTSEEEVIFNYSTGAVKYALTTKTDMSTANGCDDNCTLLINFAANGVTVLENINTLDDTSAVANELHFTETSANSGVWSNTDDADDASLNIVEAAVRGTTATIDYNDSAQSLVVAHDFATIDLDESSVGDEWNSGESMTIVLNDQDLNLNTASDEALSLSGGTLVPSMQIGSPLSLTDDSD